MGKYFDCYGCDRLINDEMLKENNNCCPRCGLSYDNKDKIEDLSKGYICPKCAKIYSNVRYRNNDGICKYCKIKLVKTDITVDELYDETTDDYLDNLDKIRIIANKYGDFQFSETAYEERLRMQHEENEAIKQRSQASNSSYSNISTTSSRSNQSTNIPKCPTCGSTNIKKIGAGERAASILGLGLFSRKINKTWKCNSCGHTW